MADGGSLLAESLKYNDALTNLNLAHNQILDQGAKAIARLLEWDTPLR